MQQNRWTASLAQRFVTGDDRRAAWRAIAVLRREGVLASIYYLGEYVTSPALVARNVEEVLALVDEGDPSGDTTTFLSLDPTQIGYSISDDLVCKNALRISRAVRDRRTFRFLMIDMEDASLVGRSIELHQRLRAEGVPIAITLQAYLRRTEADLRRLAGEGAAIRLCKGAFVGSRAVALTDRRSISDAYLSLARLLLSAPTREAGAYPILATHDLRILETLRSDIERNGWLPHQLEVEMLLGVREPLRRELLQMGYTVRVYVPFGSQWWPYAVRRVGENPANVGFVMSALLRG